MISGFNTDIEYKGITYHVQTEDKGLETPFILSLVYDRGTILASKRTPYTDLLENFNEKALSERLQKQHTIICAAITAGRIDDLKRMTEREAQKNKEEIADKVETNLNRKREKILDSSKTLVKNTTEIIDEDEIDIDLSDTNKVKINKERKSVEKSQNAPGEYSLRKSEITEILKKEGRISFTDNVKEFKEEDRFIQKDNDLSEENFKEVNELQSANQQDTNKKIKQVGESEGELKELVSEQVYLEYLDDMEGSLSIGLPAEIIFNGGEVKIFKIFVHHKISLEKVANAYITIKILGSKFKPLSFKAQTNSQGFADVQIHIPSFSEGRAAIIFKATRAFDSGELRKKVEPNKVPYI